MFRHGRSRKSLSLVESYQSSRSVLTSTRGLLIVYTGGGKGKTTAALGMALRAVGHNKKVGMIQFIKGELFTGEMEAIKKLEPNFELIRAGKGFVRIMGDKKPFDVHQEAAKNALATAREKILSGSYDLMILDEINYAAKEGLISVEDILEIIRLKPEKLTLVLTGNYADQRVIDAADLVTEMRKIKHPYEKGIPAQRGVDF